MSARRTALAAQVHDLTRGLRSLAETIRRSEVYTLVAVLVNAPEQVAGLEGRYYTRAALDPAYTTPAAVGALYRAIITGTDLDAVTRFLTPENRRTVGEAALRGWALHRDHEMLDGPHAWHRVFGDQPVTVWIGATA